MTKIDKSKIIKRRLEIAEIRDADGVFRDINEEYGTIDHLIPKCQTGNSVTL